MILWPHSPHARVFALWQPKRDPTAHCYYYYPPIEDLHTLLNRHSDTSTTLTQQVALTAGIVVARCSISCRDAWMKSAPECLFWLLQWLKHETWNVKRATCGLVQLATHSIVAGTKTTGFSGLSWKLSARWRIYILHIHIY